jgi:flagellar protein FlbD
MILLHRLGRDDTPFHLNPDLIVTVEANPDTVVHLTNGTNLVLRERPEEVVALVRTWRRSTSPLSVTPDYTPDAPSRIAS